MAGILNFTIAVISVTAIYWTVRFMIPVIARLLENIDLEGDE